jgi:hypothetical protein
MTTSEEAGTALIDRHPDTRFIIDHLGIMQPRVPPAPPQPWTDLPKVLERIKQYRHVATRYDKLAAHYLALIKLASIRIWLRAYGPRPSFGADTDKQHGHVVR